MKSSKTLVEDYLNKNDWRVNESSSAPFSYGAMTKYFNTEVSKDYWLHYVYPEYITKEYVEGRMHIHDLGGLTLYCCGYSLQKIIQMGVTGIPVIPASSPAKHFDSILNQIANLVTVFQNEIMGAVAFSSVDTLLSAFIKADNLSYKEIKQSLQNYIFSINSNSRGGSEPAFSNITLDLVPPKDLAVQPAVVGGELMDFTYGDCQKEMDLFNKAFCEIMIDGDANGRPFSYPIPTFNISKTFDWDNPNNDLLWEMAGKYGYPYFANFINSDMNPEDARSMCCRLRLDLTELRKRNGGLFGSGDSTGSIGVVTINLPRIAYEHKGDKDGFYRELDRVMDVAKDSLVIKREWVQKNVLDKGMVPAFQTYVGTLDNHFSTIGLVGGSQMCENFFGKGHDILTPEGKQMMVDVENHMRDRLLYYQQMTGNLFNLEATPAESTCYKLAKKDKEIYPDIITAGTDDAPYYTNSCHIPVNKITSIKQVFDNQDDLQILFTGGTVIHIFCNSAIPANIAKSIIKTVCTNYRVPYVSISPLNRYCPDHGYIEDDVDTCPICGKKLDKYQRITGYLRKVDNFNIGKKAEFNERVQLDLKSGY